MTTETTETNCNAWYAELILVLLHRILFTYGVGSWMNVTKRSRLAGLYMAEGVNDRSLVVTYLTVIYYLICTQYMHTRLHHYIEYGG